MAFLFIGFCLHLPGGASLFVCVFLFFLVVMGGGVEGDALVLFMQGNVLCLELLGYG